MDLRLRHLQGKRPQLGKRVYVDPCATLVGDIQLGDDASIWPMVAARGDVNHIRIGARSNIQDGTVLHLTRKSASNPGGYPLLIGEDVTVGHKAMLHGCTIGNRVLVGMGAILLDGVISRRRCDDRGGQPGAARQAARGRLSLHGQSGPAGSCPQAGRDRLPQDLGRQLCTTQGRVSARGLTPRHHKQEARHHAGLLFLYSYMSVRQGQWA